MSFFTRGPIATDSTTTSYAGYLEAIGDMAVEDESAAAPRRKSSARELPHHGNFVAHTTLRERERVAD